MKKFDWKKRWYLLLLVTIVIILGLVVLWIIDKKWIGLVIGAGLVLGWFAFVKLYLNK